LSQKEPICGIVTAIIVIAITQEAVTMNLMSLKF
jgi:hypothetical protein